MSAHLARGRQLIDLRRYDMAVEALRVAVGNDPNNPEAFTLLSLALAGSIRFEEAIEAAGEAVRLAPDYDYAHYTLAHALFRSGYLVKSLTAIAEALRICPTNPDFYALEARIFCAQKEWRRMLASAEAGLRHAPLQGDCGNLRTQALLELRRVDEAVRANQVNLQLDPSDASTHRLRGHVALAGGNFTEALEAFWESLRLDPHSEDARNGLSTALKARAAGYRLFYGLYGPIALRIFAALVAAVVVAACFFLIERKWLAAVAAIFFVPAVWYADVPREILRYFDKEFMVVFLCFDSVGRRILTRKEFGLAMGLILCGTSMLLCLVIGASLRSGPWLASALAFASVWGPADIASRDCRASGEELSMLRYSLVGLILAFVHALAVLFGLVTVPALYRFTATIVVFNLFSAVWLAGLGRMRA